MVDLMQMRRRMMLNMEKKEYIVFADPVVEQICATNWGDGIGIKPSQAAMVTNLTNEFQQNTNIVSFDELEYFSGITILNYYAKTQYGTFYNCTGLVSVAIPLSVKTLYSTFNGCSNLESVGSLENVEVLTMYAFRKCSNLAIDVYMPNLRTISNVAFNYAGITSISSLGNITSIPGATSGNQGTFAQCTSLARAVLPNTLTSIGQQAFYGCTALADVSLPNGLTTIGTNSFRGCTSLITCDLPSSVTTIGNFAFYNDTALSGEINLPNLTSLGNSAFYNCKSLSKVKSLGSITSIPGDNSNGEFRNCTGLTELDLPNTLTSIGNNAIRDCASLVTCDLPSSITTLGQNVFYNDPLLEGEINLPNLTSLGANVFAKCSSITKVKSLGSITSIPGDNSNGEFQNCTSLIEVVLPNTLTSIGTRAFFLCNNLVTCTLPQSVTTIGNMCFYGCTSLTGEIDLPNLTSIGTQTFTKTAITKIKSLGVITSIPGVGYASDGGTFHSCTSLREVTLPSTLTSIGVNCFRGCSNLETLIVPATTPPSAGDQFLIETPVTLKIYVPYSADHSILAAYQAATRWSTYASRIYELDANGNIPT